ncbi:MAG TPA: hypothetical protein VF652_07095 [Allosphingosinicella sp.]|jgi:hypothetical protein
MNIRVAFDTHAFIKRLEAAGVGAAQAEAFADALGDIVLQSIATKTDLRETEISLRAEIKDLASGLRAEMKDLELRLMTRVGIMLAASTTLTIAVLGSLNIFS